jgi:hypothetical protein
MVDVELGRKDNNLIPATAIRREFEPLDVRTTSEPD